MGATSVYTEFQMKPDYTLLFEYFRKFQKNSVDLQTFDTNMFIRHWPNFCKHYFLIGTCGALFKTTNFPVLILLLMKCWTGQHFITMSKWPHISPVYMYSICEMLPPPKKKKPKKQQQQHNNNIT